MESIAVAPRVKVSADGHGVVSHAGMGMLRELADRTGLSTQVTAVLADNYKGPWVYAPGEVFADLAAAVADGADCIDGVGQLCSLGRAFRRVFVLGVVSGVSALLRAVTAALFGVCEYIGRPSPTHSWLPPASSVRLGPFRGCRRGGRLHTAYAHRVDGVRGSGDRRGR